MQYLPVLNALPVGLIANSKNSSAPLINPDSFISDTTKNRHEYTLMMGIFLVLSKPLI